MLGKYHGDTLVKKLLIIIIKSGSTLKQQYALSNTIQVVLLSEKTSEKNTENRTNKLKIKLLVREHTDKETKGLQSTNYHLR